MPSMLADLTRRLFPTQSYKVLILGLDAAGKTTTLYKMALGEVVSTIPTIGFNLETIRISSRPRIDVDCWDVGGCDKMRPLIRYYAAGSDGCVWIVDCNDRTRVEESIDELQFFAQEFALKPKAVPFLVLANKQDLPGVMSHNEIRTRFARALQNTVHEVFPTSALLPMRHSGLQPAFQWLAHAVSSASETLIPAPAPASVPASAPSPLAERLESYLARSTADEASDPAEFLKQFNDVSLPLWDHYTHVRLAFVILTTHGRQKGKDMLFDGIANYIATSQQTTGRTFHVTMTYFWLQIVHFGIRSMGPTYPADHAFKPAASEGDLTTTSPRTVKEPASQESYPDGVSPSDFSRFVLLNPHVVDGNLWADYYSKDVMMSPAAKEGMVLPDKKPLPSVALRDVVKSSGKRL